MKLVPDPLGRFDRRPHYDPWELDDECERIVDRFLMTRRGRVEFPISTADLTVLIEDEVEDLDSAADLSALGENVEGVTDFFIAKKARVRIAAQLWDGPWREHRLRTTLSHEFGHVRFHNYLYQLEGTARLFESAAAGYPQRCKREDVHGTSGDWMEWQAGYISGAILMPASAVRQVAKAESDGEPLTLLAKMASTFDVSHDAARIRLTELRLFST